MPAKAETNIVAAAPAVLTPKPQKELIDPNDKDDEEVSQPVRKSQNNAVNIVITPKGKKVRLQALQSVFTA